MREYVSNKQIHSFITIVVRFVFLRCTLNKVGIYAKQAHKNYRDTNVDPEILT